MRWIRFGIFLLLLLLGSVAGVGSGDSHGSFLLLSFFFFFFVSWINNRIKISDFILVVAVMVGTRFLGTSLHLRQWNGAL
jgi:hypothetical protein